MTQKRFTFLLAGVFLLAFLGMNTLFTVEQREKALVLQFGELVNLHETPGLKVKIPFIQDVVKYESRLLNFNLPLIEVTAGDQKRMVIDIYMRYSIKDLLLFYKKVRNNTGAQNRLETIVNASMRRVIGRVPLAQMLSENRVRIMEQIQNEVRASGKTFGVEVRDLRVIRADLPSQNQEAIFRRMETERQQEAKQFRSEGKEKAQEIRAEADRERAVILAEARRQANVLKGEADGEVTKIYADAYGQDKEFYALYRSLEAYQASLKPEDTTFVLSPKNPFFQYFIAGGSR